MDCLKRRHGVDGCYDSCMGYAYGSILVIMGLCVTIISFVLLVNANYRLRRHHRSSSNNNNEEERTNERTKEGRARR